MSTSSPRRILLPPETQLEILRLSLSAPTLDTFDKRYSELARYSLVSRAWSGWAQGELFKIILVDSPKRASKLLKVLASHKRLGAMVEQLWFVPERFRQLQEGAASEFALPQLLRACDHLVELWTTSMRDLCLTDIAQTRNTLRSLHLVRCTLRGDVSFPFPVLRHLSMRDIRFESGPPHYLTPSFFPSLFALHWTYNRWLGRLGTSPTLLVNHVKAYSTREDLQVVDWAPGSKLELHASSIVLFSSTIVSLMPSFDFVKVVPSSIRFLFLLDTESKIETDEGELEPEGLEEALEAIAAKLGGAKKLVPNLQEVIVPMDWEEEGLVDDFAEAMRSLGVKLRIEKESRGIWEESYFEYEFFELATRVERMVEGEARARGA